MAWLEAASKAAGIVEEIASREWSEAGVEVIEAGVGEVERGDGDVPGVGYMTMRGAAGANAVSGPESGAFVVEGYVAFAFEGGLAGRLPEQEALADEPAAEVGGLGAALLRIEAGDGGDAMLDEGAVAEEDHVGASGFGMQEANVGDAAQDVVHALPLSEGEIPRGTMDVSGHPGIEDIIDAIPFRRTHQEGGSGELGRGGEDVWSGG